MTRPSSLPTDSLRYRWAVNVSEWTPSDEEFQWACHRLVLPSEAEHVRKFRFQEDRKRALVSLALQRTAGVKYLEWRRENEGCSGGPAPFCPLEDVSIGKTKGRKPYIIKPEAPGQNHASKNNFNYNVSHDGKFVVLASEPFCVCGCDVSSPGSLVSKVSKASEVSKPAARDTKVTLDAIKSTLRSFEKQLTSKEWERVYQASSSQGGEHASPSSPESTAALAVASTFSKYWSLKEAYVKGIGMGLGYDLGRIEFEILDGGREDDTLSVAFVSVDGEMREDWCCYMHRLHDDHWVSIARGPVRDVVDAHGGFKATFEVPEMTKDTLNTEVFQQQEPPFEHLRFEDVVRMGYGMQAHKEFVERFRAV